MLKTSKKSFVVGLVVVLLVSSGYIGLMTLVSRLVEDALVGTILDIVVKIFVGVLAIFIIKYKYTNGSIGLGKKGLIMGVFVYGAMLWVYIILNFTAGKSAIDRTILEALPLILLYLSMCIAIGFVEEAIFRGLVFNFLRKSLGESKGAIVVAILISSAMFGLCHLLNLVARPHMIVSTITQIIYATILGAYFAVIYYKSGNLCAPIILHTVFDFVYYVWFAFSNEAIVRSNVDISIINGVLSIALYLPVIIWSVLCFMGMFDFEKDKEIACDKNNKT